MQFQTVLKLKLCIVYSWTFLIRRCFQGNWQILYEKNSVKIPYCLAYDESVFWSSDLKGCKARERLLFKRTVGTGGSRGAHDPPPPSFWQISYPYLNQEGRLCPPHSYMPPTPPDFQTFLRPCQGSVKYLVWSCFVAKSSRRFENKLQFMYIYHFPFEKGWHQLFSLKSHKWVTSFLKEDFISMTTYLIT